MKQDNIWEHYQNESPGVFKRSRGRLTFLAKQLKNGEKVLDIGVGVGFFEKMLLTKGVDVYCLDPSERSIEKMRELLGTPEKAQVGYSSEIPFPDSSFHAVIMSEVLEHLENWEIAATLQEVYRVLLSNGRFIGTVPAREDLTAQIVVCPRCDEKFHRWGHVQSFSKERLRSMLGNLFHVKRLSEEYFIFWENLNWKGKIAATAKKSLLYCGVHGDGESLYFCARKLASHSQ